MQHDNVVPPQSAVEASWERDLINRLSFASLAEQRRSRRWGIFFKFLLFGYLFLILFMTMDRISLSEVSLSDEGHTAIVRVNGMISDATDANAERIMEGLQNAMDDSQTKGIILEINSPGGSPVQSAYIYDEIRRQRSLHESIPIYAVISDMGASGAYYIAAATDKIYVNGSSIVGSIGVLMNGFGFTSAMEKLGVERRLYTAGEHKGSLDPFSPVNPQQVGHIEELLGEIHIEFIDAVKLGRGERLADDPQLFSGLFWTGKQSIKLGLADGIGDTNYVAREIIGAEQLVDFTPKPDLLTRFADRIGVASARMLTNQLSAPSMQ